MTLPKWAGLGVHVTALPNSAGLGVGQVTALPKFFGLGVCVIGLPKVCGSVIGLPLRKSPLRFKPRGMGGPFRRWLREQDSNLRCTD